MVAGRFHPGFPANEPRRFHIVVDLGRMAPTVVGTDVVRQSII